jgi:hypothetical protein
MSSRTRLSLVIGLLALGGASSSNLGCGGGGTTGSGTGGSITGSGGAAGASGAAGAGGGATGTGGRRSTGEAGAGGRAAGGPGGAAGGLEGVGGAGGRRPGGGVDGGADAADAAGVTCAEPASCEGYDDRPDANLMAAITCLSPSSATANTGFTMTIFGHHLATGAGNDAIVTIGGGVALNGVPSSACHLEVTVPGSAIPTHGQFPVVVSPGGFTLPSDGVRFSVR